MRFEFRSTVFSNAAEMHKAIAESYFREERVRLAVGQPDPLNGKSDDQCADETIEQWLLDEPEWAKARAFSRDALILAYAALRQAGRLY